MRDFYRIGSLGMIALVLLRVGIGWHFFKEGSDKIRSGNFSSEGFLNASEGRLSGFFHAMVWDYDGSTRLDEKLMVAHYTDLIEKAKSRFSLSQEQIGQLDKVQVHFLANLEDVYGQYASEISKFKQSAPRIEKMRETPVWSEVSSLRGHQKKIENERLAEVRPALAAIDALTKRLEQQVNATIAGGQQNTSSRFRLSRPGEVGLLSTQTIDRIIPVFDLTVGILLMIGLLVPLVSWLGALFLVGVILTQFPGDPGTQPTYYQAIEALGLVVLGTIGAGRFAGLDFFIWSLRKNRKLAHPESR